MLRWEEYPELSRRDYRNHSVVRGSRRMRFMMI
jgi:hypothetical protein